MIRLAITKGRIETDAVALLERAGYDCSPLGDKGRRLFFTIHAGGGKHGGTSGEMPREKTESVEVVLAKAADVITYVERGVCDAGIVGEDTVMECGGVLYEPIDLGFGKCRMALAGIKGRNFYDGYTHKIIATKYPNIAKKYFNSRGVDVEIVKIEGSVELAPLLGLADAIVDIVETGKTLIENGLEVYEDIVNISARVVVNVASIKLKHGEMNEFLRRVETAKISI